MCKAECKALFQLPEMSLRDMKEPFTNDAFGVKIVSGGGGGVCLLPRIGILLSRVHRRGPTHGGRVLNLALEVNVERRPVAREGLEPRLDVSHVDLLKCRLPSWW